MDRINPNPYSSNEGGRGGTNDVLKPNMGRNGTPVKEEKREMVYLMRRKVKEEIVGKEDFHFEGDIKGKEDDLPQEISSSSSHSGR